nr:BamA/TamA family outer membrane protein [Pleurocapsa sp. MO_226.B13]
DTTFQNMEARIRGIFLSRAILGLIQVQVLLGSYFSRFPRSHSQSPVTPNDLSTSEQFVIGGAQSVRGYRQNARLGENGLRLSIEDRITLIKNQENTPLLQIAPFADFGIVWGDSTEDTEDNFLAGIGLGLIAEPISGLSLRLDYAPPLVNLDDTGDNVQEDGFYFRIGYRN